MIYGFLFDGGGIAITTELNELPPLGGVVTVRGRSFVVERYAGETDVGVGEGNHFHMVRAKKLKVRPFDAMLDFANSLLL